MIVSAARIFPVSSPPLTNGALLLRDGLIVRIGPREEIVDENHGVKELSFPDCVMIPGLVNAHTHLEYSALNHLAEPTDFLTWIRRLVKESKVRNIFGGKWRWKRSALKGARLALKAGITTVGDVVTFGVSPSAAAAVGLRTRAFLEAVAVSPGKVDSLAGNLAKGLDMLRRHAPTLSPGLSPHSIYTLSPEALKTVGNLASRLDLPLSVHIGETVYETELLQGKGPLAGLSSRWGLPFTSGSSRGFAEYLDEAGLLTYRTLLVHGGQLSPSDLELIGRRKSSLCTCPRSNTMLGAPLPDYSLWAKEKIPFAYGTDSLASSPDFDLFSEAHIVREKLSEPADDILRRLTLGGAEALGFGETTGSLEPSKAADLTLLRFDGASSAEAEDIVKAGSPETIAATMVGGRLLYRKG